MQSYSYAYGASAPVLPQDQGFQPLGVAASGAPPPIMMPGQAYQQPFGYSSGYAMQAPSAYAPYPMQQQYQPYNSAYPMQQQYPQYVGPQQFQQYPGPQQFQQYPQAVYGPTPMPGLPPPSSGFQYPNSGYPQGRPNTSGGFDMSSGMMGFAAGAVGGAVLDHMVTGHKQHGHNNRY